MRAPLFALPIIGAVLVFGCQGERPDYAPWTSGRAPAPTQAGQRSLTPDPDGPPAPPASPSGPPVDYGPTAGDAPNAAQPGAAPSPRLIMPGQEGAQSVTTAAEAPLHTLNLVHERIPPVLLAALADPYASPRPLTCRSLSDWIDRLTVALGPDFDASAPEHGSGVAGRGGLGLRLMNGAAGSLLPFHSILGALTGSTKHDERIIRALAAGAAQRAYLKGLGESRGCPTPATPRHPATPTPPVYDGPPRPRYPGP